MAYIGNVTGFDTVDTEQIKDGAVSDAKISDVDHSKVTGLATEISTAVSNLVDSSPASLNTLNELAAALGDDASFSTTVTNSIATKLPLAGGTMTGPVVLNTNGASNSSKGLEINTSGTNFESDDGIIQVTHAAGGSTTGGYFMKMKAGGADKFTVKGDGTVTASGLAINNAGFTTATITGNSTSETQLRFDGNTAARVSNQANTALVFDTNATEKMRITAGGLVGIGTSSPAHLLDVTGSSTTTIADFTNTNTSTGYGVYIKGGGSVGTRYALRVDDAAGNQRFRVSSSGNVGIGVTPAHKLSIFGTGVGNATVQIEGEGGADPYINFLANNAQHWSLGVDDSDSDKFKLSKHSALGTNDYLVVDTSGNVMVGTTAVGGVSSGTKTYITSTGNLYVASSGEEAAYFNRNSNDGSIVEFRKNNATVGSIGTASSKIYIGSGDAGLYFNKDGNAITPVNTTTVADNDAALDLGTTTARFKNLYLSGQINTGKVLLNDNGNSTIAGLQLGNQGIGLSVPTTDTMHFLTADQTRMTISSTGNVGIGASSPKALLAVATSSGGANNNTVGSSIAIDGPTQPITGIRWTGASHTGIGGVAYVTQIVADTANNNALEMYTTGASPLVLGTNSVEAVRIDPSGIVTKPYQPVASFSISGNGISTTANQNLFATTAVHNRALRGITHSTSTGRFTVPVAGAYYIHFFSMKNGNVTAYFDIQKNNVDIGIRPYDSSQGGGWTSYGLGGVFNLAANDYLTVIAKFAGTNTAHGQNHMNFTVYLIG